MVTPAGAAGVGGPAWARDPHARRLRGVRLARLLAPGAYAAALYPSAELRVPVGPGLRRPLVCVAAGEPPVDGTLDGPPVLVVDAAGTPDTDDYLAGGATAVWLLDADHAEQRFEDGRVALLGPADTLSVPHRPTLRLAVAQATDAVRHACRSG